jgi:transposase
MKHPKQDHHEALRFRALELSKAGWKQVKIAEALGRNPATICIWLKKAEREGPEALRNKPRPGRRCRLKQEQLDRLDRLLAQGAESHGFEGDLWTAGRVVQLVADTFGVSYSEGHMCKILKKLGWSRQKPTRRSVRRDEAAVEAWRSKRWDELKKKRRARDAKSCSSTSPASVSSR